MLARLLVTVCLCLAPERLQLISKAMTTARVTRKTSVNRSQQCFSPVVCLNLTHIFRFRSWPSHAGCVCLPSLSAKAVERDEKCFSFLRLTRYFSLSQVNMQRKAIFQLILEKRELLESQRFRRNGNNGRFQNTFKSTLHVQVASYGNSRCFSKAAK